MKPNLNLRQIEAFHAVMQTGTVTAAAQMLSITQPAISRAIGLLELRIGYKLFERRGRRLVATPEAEALYREVESVYGSLGRIAQLAQDIRFQRAGTLRIATLPALAQALVPQTIANFLASRPKVKIFVQSLPSRQIVEMVATRQFDVAVVELPLTQPSISVESLAPVPLTVIMPAAHKLAEKPLISLRDLHGERMILLSQHSYARYKIEDAFSELGVSPNVVLETPTSLMACALVAAGAGVTLVSRLAADSFTGPNVAVRPVVEHLESRYAIIYPYPGERLKLAEAFASELRTAFTDKV